MVWGGARSLEQPRLLLGGRDLLGHLDGDVHVDPRGDEHGDHAEPGGVGLGLGLGLGLGSGLGLGAGLGLGSGLGLGAGSGLGLG